MTFLGNLGIAFVAGLATPLTAVCVLPLFPAFLSYLANQISVKSKNIFLLIGWIVTAGIISSMFLVGLIFTKLLEKSLTQVIGIVSPIAFIILAIISILLLLNVNFQTLIPKYQFKFLKNPYHSSFLFGFFFGFIVLPCNPATLVVLFAVSTTTADFLINLLNFIVFGIGMALPLLILSVLSSQSSGKFIGFMTKHAKKINQIVGWSMLIVAYYYLFSVFDIFSAKEMLGVFVNLSTVGIIWIIGIVLFILSWRKE